MKEDVKFIILKDNEILKVMSENSPDSIITIICEGKSLTVDMTVGE